MEKVLVIIFLLSKLYFCGQCNSSVLPSDIFYPNSNSTPMANNGHQYLCGPNTIVYDTIDYGCRFAYVNAGCSLVLKNASCAAANTIWLKNNSTLTILPGTSLVQIFHEPMATINNQYGVSVSTTSCSSIIFPSINCTSGLNDVAYNSMVFKVWPNPCSTNINIQIENYMEFAHILVFNQLGGLIYENKNWLTSKMEIPIDFPDGSYFIQLRTNNGQHNKKLMVHR